MILPNFEWNFKGFNRQFIPHLCNARNQIKIGIDNLLMITLCIEEVATAQGLTLQLLSQFTEISLQDIQSYLSIETLTDETAANIRKIAAQLNVPVLKLVKPAAKKEAVKLSTLEEDLQIPAELPMTKLSFEELLQEQGLTVDELSMLTEIPKQSFDFAFKPFFDKKKFCDLFPCFTIICPCA